MKGLPNKIEKKLKCFGIGVIVSTVTLLNVPIGLGGGLYYTIKLWKAKYRCYKLKCKINNKIHTLSPVIGLDQHELYGVECLIKNYEYSRKKSLLFAIPLIGPYICGRSG